LRKGQYNLVYCSNCHIIVAMKELRFKFGNNLRWPDRLSQLHSKDIF
jgi:hypothetical protein